MTWQGVLAEVAEEAIRQRDACDDARRRGLNWAVAGALDPGDSLAVLIEEVGEVSRELCEARAERREPGDNLRAELIQVAAIATLWAYHLNERSFA